jgi:hypothetical protein
VGSGGVVSTGGVGSGGDGGTDGVFPECLPDTFSWNSSPPVIGPQDPAHSGLKDPSVVFHDGSYHVFATVHDTSSTTSSMVFATFGLVYMSFDDSRRHLRVLAGRGRRRGGPAKGSGAQRGQLNQESVR